MIILANHDKDQVTESLDTDLRPWLNDRGEVVAEPDIHDLERHNAHELPEADLAIVLGGDGTLLAQARSLVDQQVPLLGVNFGKVGFLAEFSIDSLKKHWSSIVCRECRQSERLLIDVDVFPAGLKRWGGASDDEVGELPEPVFSGVAMNDAVVNAGPPFRMIEIELAIEPDVARMSATTVAGDGIVVATPSGSTAYNLSAGGPIVSPGVGALCVSALLPHTLAFRPIVFPAHMDVWLYLHRANEGTTLVLDGQQSCSVGEHQQVRVRAHPKLLRLIQNPDLNYWKTLAHKMHWAVRPSRA
jgi:NAD+ kinase